MARRIIETGTNPAVTYPSTGDDDRAMGRKINENFADLERAEKARKILRNIRSGGLAKVMTTAPTVTPMGIGNPSQTVTGLAANAPMHPYDDPLLTKYSGRLVPGTRRWGWITRDAGLSSIAGMAIRFATDAEAFDIQLRNTNGYAFQVMVNGEWVRQAHYQQWGGGEFDSQSWILWKVDFGAGNSAFRIIDVFFNEYGNELGGINVGASAGVTAAANPYRLWKAGISHEPNIAVWGDSWVDATNMGHPREGFAYRIGEFLGTNRVTAFGVGGSGYVKAFGSPARKFRDRVSDIELMGDLDLIVIGPTGLNDHDITPSSLKAEVTLFAEEVIRRQPNALISVFGPQTSATLKPSLAVHDAIRDGWLAARGWNSSNMTFVETFRPRNWFDSATDTGNFSQSMYSSGDNTHPNARGHIYTAKRVADELIGWLSSIAY